MYFDEEESMMYSVAEEENKQCQVQYLFAKAVVVEVDRHLYLVKDYNLLLVDLQQGNYRYCFVVVDYYGKGYYPFLKKEEKEGKKGKKEKEGKK